MKSNINDLMLQWFNDSKEFALNNYSDSCQWLSEYVENSDWAFLQDFFTPEEIESKKYDDMKAEALAWLDANANEIVNFEDYR